VKSLGGTGFSGLLRTLASGDETEVILGLPKLDTEFSTSLKKALAAMGMPRAFDDTRAEFSGMADLGVPIYISEIVHKTKVKVDEKGTEAAAATVVEMTPGSAAVGFNMPPEIICDRPYLFAIIDEGSGAMLFLGAVGDPTK
jgi:serine protease inhibitor